MKKYYKTGIILLCIGMLGSMGGCMKGGSQSSTDSATVQGSVGWGKNGTSTTAGQDATADNETATGTEIPVGTETTEGTYEATEEIQEEAQLQEKIDYIRGYTYQIYDWPEEMDESQLIVLYEGQIKEENVSVQIYDTSAVMTMEGDLYSVYVENSEIYERLESYVFAEDGIYMYDVMSDGYAKVRE